MRKVWTLVVLILAVLCVACSDTEPKGGQGDEPPTGTSDDKDPSPDDETIVTVRNAISNSTWYGSYYYQREADLTIVDFTTVTFFYSYNNKGTGKLEVTRCGPRWENYKNALVCEMTTTLPFKFHIESNKIICESVHEKENVDITGTPERFTLEYRDGLLALLSDFTGEIFLGKGQKVYSDVNGLFVDDSESVLNSISKIWVHENGQNFLDFRNLRKVDVFRINDEGYRTFQTDGWAQYTFDDRTLYIERFEVEEYGNVFMWTLLELTEDRMVLRGYRDNDEQVFHSLSPDQLKSYPWRGYEGWGLGGYDGIFLFPDVGGGSCTSYFY